MKFINKLFSRNAVLFGYLASVIPWTIEFWAPTWLERGGRWALLATVATVIVNVVRAGMETDE